MKTIMKILTGIVLGALAGGGGMWLYMEYRQQINETLNREQLYKERRKAHRDSLMQIRAAQENREQENINEEIRQKAVERFITDFYKQAVFGDSQKKEYEVNLTQHCKEKGKDFDGGVWTLLGADIYGSDANRKELLQHLRVSHDNGDWYRVHLVQQGVTEFRYVKALVKGKDVMIDDVK